MKEEIFKNPIHQKQFDKEGYVKITLLEKSLVNKLAELSKAYFPEDSEYFFSSSYLNDFQTKEKISDEIVRLIQDSLKKHFINYRSIGAAFLIKGKGLKSEMPMHQDWTIVDENRFYALNVWIPLTATDEKNGTLEVAPGSHLWKKVKRAPTLPFPYEGYQEKIKPILRPVNTSIGEVVVLNQALIHYSKPNLSATNRPAITTGIISKNAQLSLYYWNKSNKNELEIFEQEDNFLLKFKDFHQSIFLRPVIGKSVGVIPYIIPKINAAEMDAIIENSLKAQKRSFLNRLFRLL